MPSLRLLMATTMVIGILQGKFVANMDQVGENGDCEFRRDGFDDRVLGGGFGHDLLHSVTPEKTSTNTFVCTCECACECVCISCDFFESSLFVSSQPLRALEPGRC